jgi:hypothetical protein
MYASPKGPGTRLDWTGLGTPLMNSIAEDLTWNASVPEADPPWRFSAFVLNGRPAPALTTVVASYSYWNEAVPKLQTVVENATCTVPTRNSLEITNNTVDGGQLNSSLGADIITSGALVEARSV